MNVDLLDVTHKPHVCLKAQVILMKLAVRSVGGYGWRLKQPKPLLQPYLENKNENNNERRYKVPRWVENQKAIHAKLEESR